MFEYTHHVAYVVNSMEDSLTVVVGHVFYVTRLAQARGWRAVLSHLPATRSGGPSLPAPCTFGAPQRGEWALDGVRGCAHAAHGGAAEEAGD